MRARLPAKSCMRIRWMGDWVSGLCIYAFRCILFLLRPKLKRNSQAVRRGRRRREWGVQRQALKYGISKHKINQRCVHDHGAYVHVHTPPFAFRSLNLYNTHKALANWRINIYIVWSCATCEFEKIKAENRTKMKINKWIAVYQCIRHVLLLLWLPPPSPPSMNKLSIFAVLRARASRPLPYPFSQLSVQHFMRNHWNYELNFTKVIQIFN